MSNVSPPPPSSVTVSSTAQLIAALKVGRGGETINLAPGVYSSVNLSNFNFASAVTIQSASSANPAVFTNLSLNNSSNLVFQNLTFSTTSATVGAYGAENTIPFAVSGVQNVTFNQIDVEGSSSMTLATEVSGLIVRNSSGVKITSSTFQYLHNAINQLNDTNLTISNDDFDHIQDDGIRGGGSSNVVINGNSYTNGHELAGDTDHPDFIQIWTTGTTASASNIVVENNVQTRGDGAMVQGIFIGDEVGTLPFNNVSVLHNLLIGTSYNAINVSHAINLTVDNNIVAPIPSNTAFIAVFNVSGLTETGNAAGSYTIDHYVPPPAGNTIQPTVQDGGAALLATWSVSGGGAAAAAARLLQEMAAMTGAAAHTASVVQPAAQSLTAGMIAASRA